MLIRLFFISISISKIFTFNPILQDYTNFICSKITYNSYYNQIQFKSYIQQIMLKLQQSYIPKQGQVQASTKESLIELHQAF